MTKKITINEIAKIAGVNPSTVSRALNPAKSSHLSEKLRLKIKTICDELNFRPQTSARGFAVRKSYRVGLLLGNLRHDLFNPFYSLFIRGVCGVLQNAGYTLSLLWCEHHGKETIAEQVRDFLLSDVADAYITGSGLLSEQSMEMFKHTGRPIVALANHPLKEIDNFYKVNLDFSEAISEIWQLTTPEMRQNTLYINIGSDKIELVKKYAPADAVIKTVSDEKISGDFLSDRSNGALLAQSNWDAVSKAKLIWCSSDLVALGVCDILTAHGLEIGRDIRVVGHDNFEGTYDRYSREPIISTIDPNWENSGRITAELILKCIKDSAYPKRIINCPATFVNRKSFP